MTSRWIDLTGAVNARDSGGLPVVGPDGRTGQVRPHRLLRSDNLQTLTPEDVSLLVEQIGVTDVIDLRTSIEVRNEGPGPLSAVADVAIHHLSLFPEVGARSDAAFDPETVLPETVLPWTGEVDAAAATGRSPGDATASAPPPGGGYYANYLHRRPDSVVTALRVVARSEGAALVHCAAGKDRTGVIVALALEVVGVPRADILADYAATGERIDTVLARLMESPTYAEDLRRAPAGRHVPRPENISILLEYLDEHAGGPLGWLERHGWTTADTRTLRAKLTH